MHERPFLSILDRFFVKLEIEHKASSISSIDVGGLIWITTCVTCEAKEDRETWTNCASMKCQSWI